MGPKMGKKKDKKKQKHHAKQPELDPNKPIYERDTFYSLAPNDDASLQHMIFYWHMLCGNQNRQFVHIEDIRKNDEKRERLKKNCIENMVVEITKRPAKRAGLEFLRLLCEDEEYVQAALSMMFAFEESDRAATRARIEENFEKFYNSVLDGKLSIKWLEYVLRCAAMYSDSWVPTWGVFKSFELGMKHANEFDCDMIIEATLPYITEEVIWRLFMTQKLRWMSTTLKTAVDAMPNDEKKIRNLLRNMGKLECGNVLFLVVLALRDFRTRGCITDVAHFREMRKVVDLALSIKYPTIRYMTIWTILLFFLKIYKLTLPILCQISDFITEINPHLSADFIESMFDTMKAVICGAKYTPDASESLKTAFSSDPRYYMERCTMIWALAESQGTCSKTFHSTKTCLEKMIATESYGKLAGVLAMYITRSNQAADNLFGTDEGMAKLVHAIIASSLVNNKGTLDEYHEARIVFVPIVRDLLPNLLDIEKYVKPVFDLLNNEPMDVHLNYLVYLEIMMDIMKSLNHPHYLRTCRRVEEYLGGVMEIRMGKPYNLPQGEMTRSLWLDKVDALHVVRLRLARKICSGIPSPNRAALSVEKAINDDYVCLEAKQELIGFMENFIADHPDPIGRLEVCMTHVKEQKGDAFLKLWTAFVELPLIVYRCEKHTANGHVYLDYIKRAFARPDGYANNDPRVGLAVVEAIEKQTFGEGVSDIRLAPLLIDMVLFHPGNSETLSLEISQMNQSRKEYELAIYNTRLLLLTGQLMDEDVIERIDEVVPQLVLRTLLIILSKCGYSIKWRTVVIDLLDHAIFKESSLPRVRRRALEVLLVLSVTFGKSCHGRVLTLCREVFISPTFGFHEKFLAEWMLAKMCSESKKLLRELKTGSIMRESLGSDDDAKARFRTSMDHVSTLLARTTGQSVADQSRDEESMDRMMARMFGDISIESRPGEEEEDDSEEELEDEQKEGDEGEKNRRGGAGGSGEGGEGEEEEEDDDEEEEEKEEEAVPQIPGVNAGPQRQVTELLLSDLDVRKQFNLQMILFEVPRAVGVPRDELVTAKVIQEETTGGHLRIRRVCEKNNFFWALRRSINNLKK